MVRYRRRRRSPWGRPSLLAVVAISLGGVMWWYSLGDGALSNPISLFVSGPSPVLTNNRPETETNNGARTDVAEKGDRPTVATPTHSAISTQRSGSLIEAGRQALQRGELIAARTYLSEALRNGLEDAEASLVRAELTRIGNETIFSSRILPDDPLTDRYVIQPGDSLGKIAKKNKVPVELIAHINGIRNINMIRAGQSIKTVSGPFHAELDKSAYTLDVYLGNTFAKHFKVGLGLDGSTPTGQWRVSVKLKNPTYYPPRRGQIIAADDPSNPLGERWIGLEGISGEAAGQLRYGIHGTIEPESIGKNMSLGCVRMYNEDVEALYTYLVEKHSTITVHD